MSELGESVITKAENTMLSRILDLEEIKQAVRSLHPLKSPSLDEFLGIFYITYWKTIQKRVSDFVQECIRIQTIPFTINRTLVFLILKTKGLSKINHYRPISLGNFIYKVVSKIIATRVNHVMHKIIAGN